MAYKLEQRQQGVERVEPVAVGQRVVAQVEEAQPTQRTERREHRGVCQQVVAEAQLCEHGALGVEPGEGRQLVRVRG